MSLVSKIEAKMSVVANDGRLVGFVDTVGMRHLTVNSVRDGRGFAHTLPLSWVADVEKYVFLNKGSSYVAANWDAPTKAAGARPQPRAA